MDEYMEPCDSEWRGLGVIPKSGLQLREAFSGKEPLRDVTVKAGIPTSGNLFEKAHVPVKIEKIQNSPVEVLLHREEEIETVVELQEEVQAPIERYEKLGTVRV